MSIAQVYMFDDALDYTLDNVEIDGDAARLALISKPGLSASQDFTSDAGFIYNSSLSEFNAGSLLSKSQLPASAVIGSRLSSSFDANWRTDGGSVTGQVVGVPTISGGKLNCTGTQGLNYNSNTLPIETFKLKYTPNYTGAPPANINVVASGGPTPDRCYLTHSPVGDSFRITINDVTGVAVTPTAISIAGSLGFIAGQEYEIELAVDSVAGFIYVFVDGTLVGSRNEAPWTRGGVSKRYAVGADAGFYNRAEGSFRDFITFDNVQHTANYTPGYIIPETTYVENKVDGPALSTPTIGGIVTIDDFVTTEAGAPRYTLGGLYWDGASWTASNGTYAQASDAATISANVSTFTTGTSPDVNFSVIFPTSNVLSSVSNLELDMTGQSRSPLGHIELVTPVQVSRLLSYSHDVSDATVSSYVRVILKINGVLTYWDGASWVESDGTETQSNTESEIHANLDALALDTNVSLNFRWLLVTADEEETARLETSTVQYNFGVPVTDLTRCIVYGYLKDVADDPISGATVTFHQSSPVGTYAEANRNIIARSVSLTTDQNGYFAQSLVRSSEYATGGTYIVEIKTRKGDVCVQRSSTSSNLSFTVPDADDVDITDLLP